MVGVIYGPSSIILAISLYAASVKCTPSQLTNDDGFSHTIGGENPQVMSTLELYGPPVPQHADRGFSNPVKSAYQVNINSILGILFTVIKYHTINYVYFFIILCFLCLVIAKKMCFY